MKYTWNEVEVKVSKFCLSRWVETVIDGNVVFGQEATIMITSDRLRQYLRYVSCPVA